MKAEGGATRYRVTQALLVGYAWPAIRLHPWRHIAALVSVMLGVALAYAVHLINATALDEFARAARTVNGQPDLALIGQSGQLDETLYAALARRPEIAQASPVLESMLGARSTTGQDLSMRFIGVDALKVAGVAPELFPRLGPQQNRLDLFAPDTLFLNDAARQALAIAPSYTSTIDVLRPDGSRQTLRVVGSVAAEGQPLAVMDIGALQDLLGDSHWISRIDVRLAPGVPASDLKRAFTAPAGTAWRQAEDDTRRADSLSSAYRVNLTVLALVALFTGTFLVYSVLSLSIARRRPQLALLAVLGLTARERLWLVTTEALLLGLVGSVLGLLLGSLLAATALHWVGGDLGGGYFESGARPWQWPVSPGAAFVFGWLGMAAAVIGGWWPARQAAGLQPAVALKGLGETRHSARRGHLLPLLLLASAAVLTGIPPIGGIPLGAYVAIGLLLVGGVGLLPWLIRQVTDRLAPHLAARLLPMLAVERSRHARETATVAVSGVVAALALAVALTVMVASFRDSVTRWLEAVLPADVYLRIDRQVAPQALFSAEQIAQIARLDGVVRLSAIRQLPLTLDPARPDVTLLARDFMPGDTPLQRARATLPLIGDGQPAPAGEIAIYVSESMAALYGLAPGDRLQDGVQVPGQSANGDRAIFFVSAIWRDYARQQGSFVVERNDYRRLSHDTQANELAIWLTPAADTLPAVAGPRFLAAFEQDFVTRSWRAPREALKPVNTADLRAASLRIFDRSFAVTYWLQAVAIGIGLFGVAASLSAQVLARRKEFGMLQHLGFTPGQIRLLVAGEGATWTAIGSVAGLILGLAVSVILVKVVNPQSFHWTMDMSIPMWRLSLLCLAVVAVGTVTAWLCASAHGSREAVRAVREDW